MTHVRFPLSHRGDLRVIEIMHFNTLGAKAGMCQTNIFLEYEFRTRTGGARIFSERANPRELTTPRSVSFMAAMSVLCLPSSHITKCNPLPTNFLATVAAFSCQYFVSGDEGFIMGNKIKRSSAGFDKVTATKTTKTQFYNFRARNVRILELSHLQGQTNQIINSDQFSTLYHMKRWKRIICILWFKGNIILKGHITAIEIIKLRSASKNTISGHWKILCFRGLNWSRKQKQSAHIGGQTGGKIKNLSPPIEMIID